MVGTTAGLGWLLLLSMPLADPDAAALPSREQLLFMLEFSDAEGEFIDPFEIQPLPDDASGADQDEPQDRAAEPEGDSHADLG